MSLLVQRSDVSEFRWRFRWLALGVLVIMAILIGRLFQLQLVDGAENQAIARENIVRRQVLKTTRGVIRDKNGKVLASSRPAYNVYVVPERIDMKVTWPKLASYLNLGGEERKRMERLIADLLASDGPRKTQQILLKEDVSRDAVANFKTHEAELSGASIVPVPVRYYPDGEVGAHLLGYMAEIDAEKLANLKGRGYVAGDRIGATGVERAWESYLRGTRGSEKMLVDRTGRKRTSVDDIIEEPRRVEPIPGRDLRLTIDSDIQKAMAKAFRGELAGGVVLIDVRSGRILGLYSKPSYDPNALSGGSGKQVIRDAFRRLYSDPLKPALDKTVSGAYPPGSTFKPFTALAALKKNLIDPKTNVQCRGYLNFGKRMFRCTHVHGAVNMMQAIAESCNVYFYSLASEYGVTMDLIAEMGQSFGLGKKTGLGINAEASGRMPTRAWMTLRHKGQFRLGYALNAALGQGATTVSVLQLGLAYAALANGGTLYQPQVVRAVETAEGTVVQEFTPRVREQLDIQPDHLDLVLRAMVAGVNEEGGTAYNARIEGLDIGGKTGTAQVTQRAVSGTEADKAWYFNRDHAWFAGFAPTKSPEVAVVALVEHGGSGGKHAAPIVFQVVRAYNQLKKEREAAKGAGASPTTTAKPRAGVNL